jgi:hypothetical protein
VDATQLPVFDVELLAATTSATGFYDLGRLGGHKFVLNRADQCLGFIEAQTDIAGLQVLRTATDD